MAEPPLQSIAPHGKDAEENPANHDDSMVAPPPVVDGDAALHVGSVDGDVQQLPPPQLEQQVGEVHLSTTESAKVRSAMRTKALADKAAAAASRASTSSARPKKLTPKGRWRRKKQRKRSPSLSPFPLTYEGLKMALAARARVKKLRGEESSESSEESDESDVPYWRKKQSVASSAEEGEQSEAEGRGGSCSKAKQQREGGGGRKGRPSAATAARAAEGVSSDDETMGRSMLVPKNTKTKARVVKREETSTADEREEASSKKGAKTGPKRKMSVASGVKKEDGEASTADEDGGSQSSAIRPAASRRYVRNIVRKTVQKPVMMPAKQPARHRTYREAKIPAHMAFMGVRYVSDGSYYAEETAKVKFNCGLNLAELRIGEHVHLTWQDGFAYLAEIIVFGPTKEEVDHLIDIYDMAKAAEKAESAKEPEGRRERAESRGQGMDEEHGEPMPMEDAREEPEDHMAHDDFGMGMDGLMADEQADDGEITAAERKEQEKKRVAREARREEKRREKEELQRKREERARKEEEKREQTKKKMEEEERERHAEEGEATRRASNEVAAAAAAATAGPRPAAAARPVRPPAPDFKIPKERMEQQQQRGGEAAGTSAEQEEQLGSAWALTAPRPVKGARKSAAKAMEDTVAIKTAAAAAASQQMASAPVVRREQMVVRRGEPTRDDVVESQQKQQQLPARGSVSVDPYDENTHVMKEEPIDPEFEALERAAAAAAAAHAAAPAQLLQDPMMMVNARGGGVNWALQQQHIVSRMVLHRHQRQPLQLQLQPAPGSQQRAGGGFGTTPRPMPAHGHAPIANGPGAAAAPVAASAPWTGRPVDPRVMGVPARPPLPAGRPAAPAASAAAYRPAPAAAPAARPFFPAAAAGAAAAPNHSLNGSDSKPTFQPVPPPQHMQQRLAAGPASVPQQQGPPCPVSPPSAAVMAAVRAHQSGGPAPRPVTPAAYVDPEQMIDPATGRPHGQVLAPQNAAAAAAASVNLARPVLNPFWIQPQGQYIGRPQPHHLQPQHANRDEGCADMELESDDA